jgi:hypothetical protein
MSSSEITVKLYLSFINEKALLMQCFKIQMNNVMLLY